jgi:signal transduction histidine kinase
MLWDEPRVPSPSGPSRRDWVLLGAVFACALFELAVRPELTWNSAEVLASVAVLPALLWRRQRPFAMLLLAFGACTLIELSSFVTGRDLALMNTLGFLLLLPYALFRWGSGPEAMIGLPIMLLAASIDFLSGPVSLADVVGGFAVLSASMALGAAARYRERAHERGVQQAKLDEREQLARDLHDTVAHHVSAIAIRAQAGLAVADARPGAATDALRVIAAEASRTLAEMRAIVRVLRRDDAPELSPQPQLGDLARLASVASEGPKVEVLLSGDVEQVSPSLFGTIYRLAQESITNAQKHALRATRIEVSVCADATSVRLSVRDDGERSTARASAAKGYGLIGMSERAQLLGGTCTAGPAPDRGWTVTVVLPRAEVNL